MNSIRGAIEHTIPISSLTGVLPARFLKMYAAAELRW